MGSTINLTEDQLDFVSFMKRNIASYPQLSDRLNSCLRGIADGMSGKDLTLYHSPRKMIEFLSLFSRDDRFKWYTHKWDMSAQFDIDEFIDKQKVDKNALSRMAYPKESGAAVNVSTYNQVWNFINFMNTRKKAFQWKNTKFENIPYGWHSVVELSRDNPETPVESLKLGNGHQFRDYIRMFKASIEFRTDLDDEDRFSELVWSSVTSWLPKDFTVTFSSEFDEIGYDLNVYCDVIGVLSALSIICGWIIRHKAKSSEVSVNLIVEEEYYVLEILHKGSFFNSLEKLRNPSGDFDSLRKRLFSVCDFSMEGDYEKDGRKQGSLMVKALDETTKSKGNVLSPCEVTNSENVIGGVKYKLKIYRL